MSYINKSNTSVFTFDKTQTLVNKRLNRKESMSLKRERMLENGQIKVFTQAIDSYYNSTSDSVSSPLTDETFNQTFSSTPTNSNGVNEIEMSPTTELFNSSRNLVTNIFENSVSTDEKNGQEKKIWNSEVGKRILAVHFSPMNIKSEFLSNQTMLDGFESFTLQEAVYAVREIIFKKNSNDLLVEDLCTDPRPVDLVHSAEKSRAYRKLHINDKIHLLKNAFFGLNSLKNLMAYDAQIDGWYFGNKIFSRKLIYLKHPNAYRKAVHVMDTFPDRFKSEINVLTLLFFIIIFNADLPGLKYRNSIKAEQYIYIYLLRRYLVASIEPTCEALDYFYQLMVAIEDIQALRNATEMQFDDSVADGSYLLKNRVVRLIELGSIQNNGTPLIS